MSLRTSDKLLTGRLELIDDDRVVDRYIATSGSLANQSTGSQYAKGKGPIPRMDIAGIGSYKVNVVPIPLPQVRGVEGNFYQIFPYEVRLNNQIVRGDFGIHFDANVPGSAGCIVIINRPAWDAYQKRMAQIKAEGIDEINLFIMYS